MVKDSDLENQKTLLTGLSASPNANWALVWILSLVMAIFTSFGCASVRPRVVQESVATPSAATVEPEDRHQNIPHFNVPTIQKFNPVFWFKNADEPVPPEDYKPDDKRRGLKWNLRNPFHNFTYYVIGMADKPFVRTGKHAADVFNPEQGWNWAVCKYRRVRLPFISYQNGGLKFYFGWRERGNFGIKLTF
ncbi:MAG: hypothetical protein JWM04_1156 [Verrucomicrobiales bacterium]|nr:hypothetical protein [Verrucomicrobiales bacterium]